VSSMASKGLRGSRQGTRDSELMQVWRNLNIGARRCDGCGRNPVERIRILAPASDVLQGSPGLEGLINMGAIAPEDFRAMLVDIEGTPMLPVSDVVACRTCAPVAESVAAKAPSWCHVMIRKGPKEERLTVAPDPSAPLKAKLGLVP
jgi:hypothetical protein